MIKFLSNIPVFLFKPFFFAGGDVRIKDVCYKPVHMIIFLFFAVISFLTKSLPYYDPSR